MIEELLVCPLCGHQNPADARYCQNDGAPLREGDPEDPLVGRLVGNYRLLMRKGEGGFGVVYHAEHRELGTRFAVKILHPQFSANRQIAERFRREALAAGRLRHENVVYIADFGHAQGIGYYYAMEFLEGRTLKECIDSGEDFSANRIIHIARQVTSAMSRVHSLKIIHRDLKPENIFLITKDGARDHVKLVDFGIAKILDDEAGSNLTRTGLSVGTPLYMSPEQARGNLRALDHRTDLYSWGVILFELLTGKPPFYSDSPHDVVLLHIRAKPPSLVETASQKAFSEALEGFVQKLLSKKPVDRPSSMLDSYQELEAILREPDAILDKSLAPPPSAFSLSPPLELEESQDDDARVMTPVSNPATREILQADAETTQISSTGEQLSEHALRQLDGDDEATSPLLQPDSTYNPDWRSVFQADDIEQDDSDEPTIVTSKSALQDEVNALIAAQEQQQEPQNEYDPNPDTAPTDIIPAPKRPTPAPPSQEPEPPPVTFPSTSEPPSSVPPPSTPPPSSIPTTKTGPPSSIPPPSTPPPSTKAPATPVPRFSQVEVEPAEAHESLATDPDALHAPKRYALLAIVALAFLSILVFAFFFSRTKPPLKGPKLNINPSKTLTKTRKRIKTLPRRPQRRPVAPKREVLPRQIVLPRQPPPVDRTPARPVDSGSTPEPRLRAVVVPAPAPKTYTLRIRSTPQASVYIGRRRMGSTPLSVSGQSNKSLRIKIIRAGHYVVRRTWRPKRNSQWRLQLKPKRSKPTPRRTTKPPKRDDIFQNVDNPFARKKPPKNR